MITFESQPLLVLGALRGVGGLTFGLSMRYLGIALGYAVALAPVVETAVVRGVPTLWAALPLLVVILLGGPTTNLVWCLVLNARRGTFGEYAGRAATGARAPVVGDVLFCAAAGVAWYLQFFFYSMGESRMGAGAARVSPRWCWPR